MIQLVKTPTSNIFMNNVSSANESIFLCAPFIKTDIVDSILKLKKENLKLTVITSSNLSSFARGASDIDAIVKLLKNSVEVYNHQGLHAKIYLFDKTKAIVTSANLTYSGMNKNYEYGIYTDEGNIVQQVANDCSLLLSDELSGKFKQDDIDYIKDQVDILRNVDFKVRTDLNGDEIFSSESYDIAKTLIGWQKIIFQVIADKMNDEFSLKELTDNRDVFKVYYPKNKHIDDKIRQGLQQLRDKGLIKFIDRGKYKKLFITNMNLHK